MELGHLYSKGKPVDPVDAQIAGISLVNNQTLVTNNAKHFERFPDLKIEMY